MGNGIGIGIVCNGGMELGRGIEIGTWSMD